MAFSKSLVERIHHLVSRQRGITEKKMFGGVCFLLNGNLLVGVWKDSLIARIGKDAYEQPTTTGVVHLVAGAESRHERSAVWLS